MLINSLPPNQPITNQVQYNCTGSACTFERRTSKKVCNTRLDSTFNKLSIVALKRDRPALPSRSPATQPLSSSNKGAVMSETSRGGTPETKLIVPSNRPARFAFACAGGFFGSTLSSIAVSSPSAMCGCPVGPGPPGRAGIIHSIYPLQVSLQD